MAEEIRRISCLDSRIRDNPCMEPATWEVLGPMPAYYCEEHIEDLIADDMNERWEQWGAVAPGPPRRLSLPLASREYYA